jgi:GT2 family glycosyltransferase
VLHYNSNESLFQVIEAITQQTSKVYKIVVVDNGNTISSHNEKRLSRFDLDIIGLSENLGVGAGHNYGWKYCLENYKPDYLWVFEHDAIPAVDCLQKILNHVTENPLVAYCPYEIDGLNYENSKYFLVRPFRLIRLTDKSKLGIYKGGLSFNGLLIKPELLKMIGYLNEEYFITREDIDFYQRIYGSNGYVLRIPDAQVHHNLHKDKKQFKIGNNVFLLSNQSLLREY